MGFYWLSRNITGDSIFNFKFWNCRLHWIYSFVVSMSVSYSVSMLELVTVLYLVAFEWIMPLNNRNQNPLELHLVFELSTSHASLDAIKFWQGILNTFLKYSVPLNLVLIKYYSMLLVASKSSFDVFEKNQDSFETSLPKSDLVTIA